MPLAANLPYYTGLQFAPGAEESRLRSGKTDVQKLRHIRHGKLLHISQNQWFSQKLWQTPQFSMQ